MPSTPPTPPATQAPALPNAGDRTPDMGTNHGVERHSHFYEESENLKDGVVLRAGDTLYRLSRYYLVSGCEFFSDAFSPLIGNPGEGTSDTSPVVLPVGSMEFNVYLLFDRFYRPDPPPEELIAGIRLAQMWNAPRLFHYSLDHFTRQFKAGTIHPAVVLAVARANGIPSLIKPAVRALAEPNMPLHSWGCDGGILGYVAVEEIGAIARMREKLSLARLAILDVPPVTHANDCTSEPNCAQAWAWYWHVNVGKKIRRLCDDTIPHQLWYIRSTDILQAKVPGMGLLCLRITAEHVAHNACWFSNDHIINGAVEYLMVPARVPEWSGPS